jgi:hypothetical protein
MTTPKEFGSDPQAAAGEAPVWQPQPRMADPETMAVDAGAFDAAGSGDGEVHVAPAEAGIPMAMPARQAMPESLRRTRRAGSTTMLLVISALIALGGVGFAVGRATSNGTGTNTTNDTGANGVPNGFPGGPGASGNPNFGGLGGGLTSGSATISGTVVSATADSLTLQVANGQTVTLAIGSSTTYHSQAAASSTDLAAGKTVTVQTSGSVAGAGSASAGASAGTTGTRTATDVTITSN